MIQKIKSVISFTIKGIHPHDIATILDDDGVAIRAGHHCCQILHEKIGMSATARASIGLYNTKEDIDILINAIKNVKRFLKYNGIKRVISRNNFRSWKKSKKFWKCKNYTSDAKGHNPLCGDKVHIYAQLDKNKKILDLSFEGEGCAISLASASILTDILKAKILI